MLCVCLVLTHGFTTAHRVSLINLQTYHCIPCMNKIPLTKENFISDQLQTFFILTAKKFINYMWQRSRRYCVRRAKQTQNYWGCLKRLILSLFIPWVEADWAFIYVLIIELGPKFLPLSYWSDASNNLCQGRIYIRNLIQQMWDGLCIYYNFASNKLSLNPPIHTSLFGQKS